ncbi:MAG: ribonucleoside-diphosphate reductase, adenosylcobalamin-dependent [Candidatus Dojkabacteria bacterium]
MISLDCSHPDLEEFINVKSDLNKITKANISIRITDNFMESVKNDKDWKLTYTRQETGEVIEKIVKAKELFNALAKMNWDYAEPGLLNWDRITSWNLLSEDKIFEYAGINPCAEEPLPAGGSCLLGSINLSEFIINPFTKEAKFDIINFTEAVKQSVIALNEVLHEGLLLHPLKEQQESVNAWRQIGLGIFGWHDALIKLGIRYGSNDSLKLVDSIGLEMINTAILVSAELTDIYGQYPMYNQNAIFKSKFFLNNTTEETRKIVKEKGLANSQLLTIAPTGSIGTMLGVSTGIEPMYEIAYTRKTESLHGKDEYYKVYTPIVEHYMKLNNIDGEQQLPKYFNNAITLDYKERIDMQSTWQKYIDASISSTINLPNNFPLDEVKELYMLAWEKGLKGVTIYRSGCKREGILTANIDNKNLYEELPRGFIENVPEDLNYRKYKLKTGCGSLYFFVGIDENDNKIYDCFTNTDGVGGCPINTQANSRLLSACLRGGVPVEYVIQQLNKSGTCPSFQYKRGKGEKLSKGKSCPSAIANILNDILKEFEKNEKEEVTIKNICPECGTELRFEGGCSSCSNCGWSRCS